MNAQYAAFLNGCDNADWPQFLDIRLTRATEDLHQADLALSIDTRLNWLRGHFPQQPVLPGIVQVDWAAQLAIRLFGLDASGFSGVEQLKFLAIIQPPLALSLVLNYEAAAHCVTFRYESGTQIYSKGKIRFR